MKNLLVIIFFILLIIVLGEAIVYLYLPKKRSATEIPQLSSRQTAGSFKIISQFKNDTSGRTVVYESTATNSYSGWNGKNYQVGFFDSWQEIKNSSDRYIIIKDKNNQEKILFRVVYEPTDIKIARATSFGVENLNELINSSEQGWATEGVLQLSDLGYSRLDKIIKKGDTVVVSLWVVDNKIKTDQWGIKIARMLIVRRFGGQKEL